MTMLGLVLIALAIIIGISVFNNSYSAVWDKLSKGQL